MLSQFVYPLMFGYMCAHAYGWKKSVWWAIGVGAVHIALLCIGW
jgi:hypothetical protein